MIHSWKDDVFFADKVLYAYLVVEVGDLCLAFVAELFLYFVQFLPDDVEALSFVGKELLQPGDDAAVLLRGSAFLWAESPQSSAFRKQLCRGIIPAPRHLGGRSSAMRRWDFLVSLASPIGGWVPTLESRIL